MVALSSVAVIAIALTAQNLIPASVPGDTATPGPSPTPIPEPTHTATHAPECYRLDPLGYAHWQEYCLFLPRNRQPPSPTPRPTTTTTPSPTATPTPAISCSDVITNGDFEAGPGVGWTEVSPIDQPIISTEAPYEGRYGVFLGGYDNADEGIFTSYFIDHRPEDRGLPGDIISAELTFKWAIASRDSRDEVRDIFVAAFIGEDPEEPEILDARTNVDQRGPWSSWGQNVTARLVERPGWQHSVLGFTAFTDGSDPTSFFVDNVRLEVCVRGASVGHVRDIVPDTTALAEGLERVKEIARFSVGRPGENWRSARFFLGPK